MKSLNFWDDFRNISLKSSANTTSTWAGPDAEETYVKVKKSRNLKTYDKDDFSYTRNSLGFRSAELDNSDPIKILYGGCSLTEGIGLKVEHTWRGFLNDLIGKELNKTIVPYSVGLGGASIDSIIRMLYITITKKQFKPDLVLLLLPSVARSELVIEDDYGNLGMYDFIPTFSHGTTKLTRLHEVTLKHMSIRHRINDAFRNLILLKETLDARNIPFYFGIWDNFMFGHNEHDNSYKTFSEILNTDSPISIRRRFLPVTMNFNEKYLQKHFEQNIGRDGLHPGPNVHFDYATKVFDHLKKQDDFKELLEKWKNS